MDDFLSALPGLILLFGSIIWFHIWLQKKEDQIKKKRKEEHEKSIQIQKKYEEDEARARHEAYMNRLFPEPEMRARADEYLKSKTDKLFGSYSNNGIKKFIEKETTTRQQEIVKIVQFLKEDLSLKEGDIFISEAVKNAFDAMSFDERFEYDVLDWEEQKQIWIEWVKQLKT